MPWRVHLLPTLQSLAAISALAAPFATFSAAIVVAVALARTAVAPVPESATADAKVSVRVNKATEPAEQQLSAHSTSQLSLWQAISPLADAKVQQPRSALRR